MGVSKRSNYSREVTLEHRFFHGEPIRKSMQTLTLSAVLSPENGGYVALCPELDIASQGESIDQAVANLKEAVEGFLEVASQNEIEGRLKKPSLFTHFEV